MGTRRGFPVRKVYDCTQNPDSTQALSISEEIINSFLSGETDAVELLYTKFVSLIASSPSVRTLVPFSASEISQKGDEVFQLTSNGGEFGVERKELDVAEPQEFPNDRIFWRLSREPLHWKDKENAHRNQADANSANERCVNEVHFCTYCSSSGCVVGNRFETGSLSRVDGIDLC